MNIPTPAQALGEVSEKYQAMCERPDFLHQQAFRVAAEQLWETHGHHFAGLEAEVERLISDVNDYRQAAAAEAQYANGQEARAEAAEGRLREIAAEASLAHARCAEAEGLLLKCRDPLYYITLEIGGEQGREADSLNFDIAAFLAARG